MDKEVKGLGAKLISIQTKIKSGKTEYNSFGKYNYRKLENILEDLKPLLKEEQCIITLSDELVNMADRFYIKATATITDGVNSISVSSYAREALNKKGMDDSQITGACSTYARKYALAGLLLLDDREDADSDIKQEVKREVNPNNKKTLQEPDKDPEDGLYSSDRIVEIIFNYCDEPMIQKYKQWAEVDDWDKLPIDKAYKILANMRKKGLYNE